jgi:peptide/nickel transport system permease protein
LLSFLTQRLLQIIPTLILVSMLIFGLQQLLPGDPALIMAGEERDPAVLEEIRQQYRLNEPIPIQYFYWIKGVLSGNLGESMRLKASVGSLVSEKLPVTLQLAAMAIVVALGIGIPAGIISAVKKDTAWDYGANIFALWGISTPNFWLGILMIFLFSVTLGWLPASGYVRLGEDWRASLATTVMPAFVLGNAIAAVLMRHTRSAMLQAMGADYVRTARAKGLHDTRVIFGHALKNAAIPLVTVIGLDMGTLLGGAVVTEQIFAWPGVGLEVIMAINGRDFPVVQAAVFVVATSFVLINLIVDLLYTWLDPRVRLA